MLNSFVRASFVKNPGFFIRILLKISNSRINLAQELFIGKMLEGNGRGGTHGVTETISFTEDRINPGFSALRCIVKLYGAICTNGDTGPAGNTLILIHLTNRAGGGDCIM
jgi:hypothetical protein